MSHRLHLLWEIEDPSWVLVHESPGTDVWPEDKGLDHSNVMQVDTEVYGGTSEQVECHQGGADDKAPRNVSFCSSHNYAGTL